MRKLALCLEYPLKLRGGVSVLVETLLRGLAHKFSLVLVSPDRSTEEAGVDPSLYEHVFWDPARVSVSTSRLLVNRLAELEVGITHFHCGGNYGWGIRFPNQSPIVFASKRGMQVFVSDHLVVDIVTGYCGPQRPLWFKLLFLPVAWLGKMQALWHAKGEVAVSNHDLHKLQRWYWPLRRRLRRIYHSRLVEEGNGIITVREKIVLSVGHIAYRKGQHVLVRAFASIARDHPEWRLKIIGHVGEEDCRSEIEAIRRESGLEDRIEILGQRNDVLELMRRAGIFVQPSRHEAIGLALQEALWHGCACIGTSAGGIPELIDHGQNGLLVPPDNPPALASALDQLLVDQELRERFSAAAHPSIVAKGMTAARMLEEHLKLYAEASST